MKKLLCVLLASFFVPMVVFAIRFDDADKKDSEELETGNVLSSEAGRFVFGRTSTHRSDQFMLDTESGALWQIAQDENGTPLLLPVPYINVDGTKTQIPVQFPGALNREVLEKKKASPGKEDASE